MVDPADGELICIAPNPRGFLSVVDVRMNAKDQWLLYVADMNRKGFDVAFSGQLYRRSVAEQLVADGLLRKTQAVVCDGDGRHVEPERWREGYELTPAGRAAVDVLERYSST